MVGRSTLGPQVPVSDNDLIVESKSQARFLPVGSLTTRSTACALVR
jgi:hypothetical protein